MPVYEYRCRNCGHGFEIQQAMSEDSLTDCPQCGEPQLRKVFQPVGIAFKGSGFYKNDARSSSGASRSTSSTSSSNGSSSDTKSSESTKSETAKPESSSASSSGD